MRSLKKRFERWYGKLPENSRFMVDLVREKVVPVFLARGFVWTDDYALGKSTEVGTNEIVLQLREGDGWPTVQIFFSPGGKPWFCIDFGLISDGAYRYDGRVVNKQEATINQASIRLSLAKTKGTVRSLFTQFGYHYFSFSPKKKTTAEVEYALSLLPVIFDLFENGIPNEWKNIKNAYASQNVYKFFRPDFESMHSKDGIAMRPQ